MTYHHTSNNRCEFNTTYHRFFSKGYAKQTHPEEEELIAAEPGIAYKEKYLY